jgi:signal transduction histidine kinase
MAQQLVDVEKTHDFVSFHSLTTHLGWRPDFGAIEQRKRVFRSILSVSLVLIVMALAAMGAFIYRLRRTRKRVQGLVMQTLAHELRTPVASMQYTIDEFRRRFEELPSTLQDGFLSLCEDNQRLVELIKASGGMIKDGARLPRNTYSSANNLLAALVEPFGESISFIPSPTDFPFATDSYWLGVCLKNLIENAVRYGHPPVFVRLAESDASCVISVEDQGTYHRRPLRKTRDGGGLGMGLVITREFTRLLGGSFRFQKRPHTSFSIQLPKGVTG